MIPGLIIPHAGFSDPAVEVVLASGGAINASTLFSAETWAADVKKRIILPAGYTRGSSAVATPAFRSGTGRGGLLEIIINGDLDGAGGAVNGGVGGDALLLEQSGCILKGTGRLRAGGGGGGKGGNGGAGSYTAQEGPSYGYPGSPSYYWVRINSSNDNQPQNNVYRSDIVWNGVAIGSATYAVTSVTFGIYTYYRYTQMLYQSDSGSSWSWSNYFHQLYRQWLASTSGGVAPNAGRGQGYDGAATAGGASVAGGTNAGASGTSGAGGGFGSSGTAGTSGANGNAGSGVAATAAGLAGFAISGLANLTNLFSGTALGRTG